MDHLFTLTYPLNPNDHDTDAILKRLAEAGCNDAMVGLGKPGHLALAFTREAPCLEAATTSALEDVRKALPTATLLNFQVG